MSIEPLHPTATFDGISVFEPEFWTKLNAMASVCARVGGLKPGDGIAGANSAAGMHLYTPAPGERPPEVFPATLTANLEDEIPGKYEFRELMPGPDGTWLTKVGIGARYDSLGTAARATICFEFELNETIEVGTPVLMVVKFDANHQPHYRFSYCCRPDGGSDSSGGGGGGGGFGFSAIGRNRCVPCPDEPGCVKFQMRVDTWNASGVITSSEWVDFDGSCCVQLCGSQSSGSSDGPPPPSSGSSSDSICQTVCVQGAGEAEYNGEYTYDPDEQGGVWVHSDGSHFISFIGGGGIGPWLMFNDVDIPVAYHNPSEDPLCPPGAGWLQGVPESALPVPTVTEGGCPSVSSSSSSSSASSSSSSSSAGPTAVRYTPCGSNSGLPDLYFDTDAEGLGDVIRYET